MLFNGAHGFKKDMTVHYSVTGYLNKKFTHPGFTNTIIKYPFPTFRLAELYLNYAEALIEIGGSNNLKIAKKYMDKVRKRAGIPGVDESIQKYANDEWKGKENEQETLRQFVRQERQIEFYLEGQRFWDLRRWKIAEKLDEPFLCWNIEGASVEEFFKAPQPNMTLTNHFYKSQYLLPISASELEKTPQIIQNPFY
jgi:starch-binding outer membrane protein, SusD/RagB family